MLNIIYILVEEHIMTNKPLAIRKTRITRIIVGLIGIAFRLSNLSKIMPATDSITIIMSS